MKKLLSILGSLTLAASASSAVIACSSETHVLTPDDYMNNNYNNIMAASLEKAKSVIINNEHGISQNFIDSQQKFDKVVDQGFKDLNYDDIGGKNANVQTLVNKYYSGSVVSNNGNSGIDLSGKNGDTNTFNTLIDKALSVFPDLNNPIVRSVLINGKDNILGWMETTAKTVNANKLNAFNVAGYNQAISGGEYIINTAIQVGIAWLNTQVTTGKDDKGIFNSIEKIIIDIINGKNDLATNTLPSFFSSDKVNLVRNIATQLLGTTNGKITPLQDSVYQNKDVAIQNTSDASKPVVKLSDYFSKFNDGSSKLGVSGWSDSDKIKEIDVKNIKDELLSSIYRIVSTILNPKVIQMFISDDSESDTLNYKYQRFNDNLEDIVSGLISAAISNSFTKDAEGNLAFKDAEGNIISLLNPDLKSQVNIMGLVWEALRDITLINAQFSIFENTYSNSAIDSQHIFGNVKGQNMAGVKIADNYNYTVMNDLVNAKLTDCNFLKFDDEPININYFFSNLDYYLGKIESKSDDAVYRIQKFLFIIFNDPTKSKRTDGTTVPTSQSWRDKQSDLLDFIVDTAFKTGKKFVDAKLADNKLSDEDRNTFTAVQKVLKSISKVDINSLENALLKPLILGLINGESIQGLLKTALSGVEAAYNTMSDVKTLLDGLSAVGIDIHEVFKVAHKLIDKHRFGNDTIHQLFIQDYRDIIDGLKFIPQEWIDKLFGTNEVNLTTLVSMPIFNILSIAGIPGFKDGKISPYADYFTTGSIPWLANFLDGFLNGINNDVPSQYLVLRNDDINNPKEKDSSKWTPDYRTSIKARDLNLNAIYDLFISIVGKDGKDNIFSKLLKDFVVTDLHGATYDKNDKNSKVKDFNKVEIKLDPLAATSDLGLKNQKDKSDSQWDSESKAKTLNKKNDASSNEMTGTISDDLKTITFDIPEGITIPDDSALNTNGKNADKDHGALKFTNNLPPNEEDYSAVATGNKIIVSLPSPWAQTNNKQVVSVEYDSPVNVDENNPGKLVGTFTVPPKYTGGVDLIIDKQSVAGGLYRLSLPEIDQQNSGAYSDENADGTFTMHDKYLETDLLKTDYGDFVNLLYWLNEPGTYENFVQSMLQNNKAFNLYINQDDITYFRDDPLVIQGFKFRVSYRNYVAGKTVNYVFTVSRQSNINGFEIKQLVTDKNK